MPGLPGRFDLDAAESSEAWQEELVAEHIPETEEYGISSFTVCYRRPFHPQRLFDWLQLSVPGVVRARGFFWIAPYPQLALFLSQAGTQKRIDLAGYWWSAVDILQWPRETELRDEELAGMTSDNIEERCSQLPNPFAEHIEVPEEV